MNLETYINNLVSNGLDREHWFMTKQTMSNYYFPFYVAHVVETFKEHHLSNQNFQEYYTQCFKENPDTLRLFPKQSESENTYRNAIIAEFLGLIERTDRTYANAQVTPAYQTLKNYITTEADISNNREIVDRQIEKICLNVITSASKYPDVSDVTIFPVVFLYKILTKLYEKYQDSKLTYEEFSIFVMRTEDYSDYDNVIDLIEQYRNHQYDEECTKKIKTIMAHQSTKNVRFDTLFGTLSNIDYEKNQYYRIKNSNESYNSILNVIQSYEQSDIFNEKSKDKLKKFMQSDNYFQGKIDKVTSNLFLSDEQFEKLVVEEDEYINKLKSLADKYGIKGTTKVLTEVRLSSVQIALRDRLIHDHSSKCILCNISNKEMLIASHIKDSAECDIYEKADTENALLLCANHDKLFDKFLITFRFYDGKIEISKSLTEEENEICMLNEDYYLPTELLTPKRQQYLMWHNETYYKRENER